MMGGGGAESVPPIFICEKNKKMIMQCVWFIILSGSSEDKAIFHVI